MRRWRKHYPWTECWLPQKVLVRHHTVLGTWSSVNITTTASSLSLIFPFHLRPDPVLFIGKLPQRSDTSRLALNGGQMILKSFYRDNLGKNILSTEKLTLKLRWKSVSVMRGDAEVRGWGEARSPSFHHLRSPSLLMRDNAGHAHISLHHIIITDHGSCQSSLFWLKSL